MIRHGGGHVGGHHVVHHGGHHLQHRGLHGALFYYGYWPSSSWYPSYGRAVRPASDPTTYASGTPPPDIPRRDTAPPSVPDGTPLFAPLVETLEAPEALPPPDEEEDDSETDDDRPPIPHEHKVSHR